METQKRTWTPWAAPPLQERRANLKLQMFFKIRSNIVYCPHEDLIPLRTPRRPLNYFIPQSNVEAHLHSFFPSSIRLWNSLPENIKSSDSLTAFKSAISTVTICSSYLFIFTKNSTLWSRTDGLFTNAEKNSHRNLRFNRQKALVFYSETRVHEPYRSNSVCQNNRSLTELPIKPM